MLDPYRYLAGGFDTLLLVHGDGANGGSVFTDSSSYARTPTVNGTPTTVTDGAAFGGSSIAFVAAQCVDYSASGGFLASATDDYTIEGFLIVTAIGTPNDGYADTRYESLRITNGGVKVHTFGALSSATYIWSLPVAGQQALDTTIRRHFAITRTGGSVVKAWIDGTNYGSDGTSSVNFDLIRIGNAPLGSSRNNAGRIEEVRVSRGARYTATFTPPASAFVDD